MIWPLLRTAWGFLGKNKIKKKKKKTKKKSRNKLLCQPAIPLLGICPEKSVLLKDICAPMFIAALFTITKAQK